MPSPAITACFGAKGRGGWLCWKLETIWALNASPLPAPFLLLLLAAPSLFSNHTDTLDALRPSSSSSPQAQQTCRFLVLLLLRLLLSSLLLLLPLLLVFFVIHHSPLFSLSLLLDKYLFMLPTLAVSLLLYYLILSKFIPCFFFFFFFSKCRKCKEKTPAAASTHVYPELRSSGRRGEQRRLSSRSAAALATMLGGLM